MITLLRRLFIKDWQNVSDEKVRSKHGLLAASIGLISNILLALAKIGIAIYCAALDEWIAVPLAIISDAINNLSDGFSNLLVMIGFKEAGKPADKEHPFGHQRTEYIVSLVISCLIIVYGIEMGVKSISGIIEPSYITYGIATVITYCISIVAKGFQCYCYIGLGRAINSQAVKSNTWDALGDILSSVAILAVAILDMVYGANYLDPYLSLCVSVLIVVGGIKLIRDSINPLIGSPQDKGVVERVKKIVASKHGALAIHDIIIHSYGPTEKYITFHLEVPSDLSLLEAHHIADDIERAIQDAEHAHVLIHIDPHTSTKEMKEIEKVCNEILSSFDADIRIHDLQIAKNNKQQEISFDVLLPFSDTDKKGKIEKMLRKSLTDLYPEYVVKINFDHPF